MAEVSNAHMQLQLCHALNLLSQNHADIECTAGERTILHWQKGMTTTFLSTLS